MTDALLEVTIILILVVTNGLLAGSEIAVVSAKKARLHQRAREGSDPARRALDLANHPNRFLSTVQIGITTIAVIAGAFGGARVAATLAPGLAGVGVPALIAHETALVLVVMGITYLTLVVGELVPKRIALHDPERMAMRAARPMQRLSVLATPLVQLLGASTDLVLRLVPLGEREEAEITEEEIKGMIAHATEAGVLEATEQQIVERLFRLSDQTVDRIMTPRDRIVWLDREAGPESWRRYLSGVRHTRYVVADGELDRFAGYIMVRDVLQRLVAGEGLSLEGLLREPHVLPPWTPVFRLLEQFQWSGDHIALIAADDGHVAGIVTLNDVLAGIVGDMPQVQEIVAPGVAEREDGSWLVDGLIPFDEFATIFHRRGDEVGRYPTLHAFMVARLDDPPRRTAVVGWKGLRLEIVDMDGSRVDQVLVTEEPATSPADSDPGARRPPRPDN
jgi:putative hemolysin